MKPPIVLDYNATKGKNILIMCSLFYFYGIFYTVVDAVNIIVIYLTCTGGVDTALVLCLVLIIVWESQNWGASLLFTQK